MILGTTRIGVERRSPDRVKKVLKPVTSVTKDEEPVPDLLLPFWPRTIGTGPEDEAMKNEEGTIPADRMRMIQEMRERYLNGTLDEVLIPEEADFSALLSDLAAEEDVSTGPQLESIRTPREKTA